MLMSGKVLSLSPSSSSPSSNTSIPASSSKPNSPLNASSPSTGSQNNFTGYSSPSSRDKFSPTSVSSSFFSSSSPSHQSSTLLNSWSSRPLGSHNFRNTTSHVNSRSNSTISLSESCQCGVTQKMCQRLTSSGLIRRLLLKCRVTRSCSQSCSKVKIT